MRLKPLKKGKNQAGEEVERVFWLASEDQHDELFCRGKTPVVAKGTIKRADFGMKFALRGVSNEVEIEIQALAVKQ